VERVFRAPEGFAVREPGGTGADPRQVLVALRAEGEHPGILHLTMEGGSAPSPLAEVLPRIARPVALALRDVVRLTALRRREEEQRRLLAVTNMLVGEVETGPLFHAIGEHLRAVLPVVSYGIALYNPESDAFDRGMFMTGSGEFRSFEPIPRQGTKFGDVVARRSTVVLTADEVRSSLNRFPSLLDAAGDRAVCAVVIPLVGRRGGVFAVVAATVPETLTLRESDIGFLNQLAGQLALAIQNMEAFQEIQRLRRRLEAEGEYLKEELRETADTQGLLYASAALADAMRAVGKAAATDATVLLLGETGTGKELFARRIHELSRHADRPLVKVNCGAIPAALLESALFGHERGAFTGAVQQHIGLFELAHLGSILLDEIGEMPPEMQVKLLRVLQEGEFMRVGGREPIRVRVRVIAATHRSLDAMVAQGSFRADLYYRLAVFPIRIPPLRERQEDIPLLASFFVHKYARRFRKPARTIADGAMALLRSYRFPGNVRELENMIERGVVLCDGEVLGREHLPVPDPDGSLSVAAGAASEEERIRQTLRATNWLIEGPRGAAHRLGVKPSTLRSRMARFGIRRTPGP
jgi:formate hydrogenlyase transcriptional activator